MSARMKTLTLAIVALLASTLAFHAHAQACAQYDEVQIQLKWLQQAQFSGYMVAVEEGFYTEECLDVAIRPGGPNINMELEVMEGRAQFGIDWMASLLVEREAGYDVVIISQVFTRAGNSEITMAKSNIRQPSDLKGKNVCVWYGGNELSLRALFDESKMKWDNDTSINQQSGSDANCISQAFTETEFLAGHCDAAAATRYNELALVLESINPATGALYSESTDLYIFNYADYNITTFEDGLFVSKAWLEQPGNKDIALRFMRATIKGWLFGRDFPGLVNENIFSRNVHQQWQLNEVNRLIFPTSAQGFGVQTDEAMQASADRVYKYGILSHSPNVTDFYRSDLALEAYLGFTGQLPSVTPKAGWNADADNGVLGSQDVIGASYVPSDLRFCLNSDVLAICEGVRRPSADDALLRDSGVAIALEVLAATSLGVIAMIAGALVLYRRERVIISASLPFCLTICLGGMIFLSAIFPSTGVATTGSCHTRLWLMAVGFCVMMGSFLIKVRRIDLIFSNKSMQTQKLPNDLLFRQLGALLLIEVVLMALFSGLSDYNADTFDDLGNGKLTHQLCRIQNSAAGSAMTALIFVYNGLLLLYCIVLAYRTKDVLTSFNESQWLALAAYNMSIIVIVVVPISFFLGVSTRVQLIIADIGILVGVMLSTLLLFSPKLWSAYHGSVPSDGTATRGDVSFVGGQMDTREGKKRTLANGKDRMNTRYASETSGGVSNLPIEHAAAWARGLRGLGTTALLGHLTTFSMRQKLVHEELQSRGLKDEEIEKALWQQTEDGTEGGVEMAAQSPRANGVGNEYGGGKGRPNLTVASNTAGRPSVTTSQTISAYANGTHGGGQQHSAHRGKLLHSAASPRGAPSPTLPRSDSMSGKSISPPQETNAPSTKPASPELRSRSIPELQSTNRNSHHMEAPEDAPAVRSLADDLPTSPSMVGGDATSHPIAPSSGAAPWSSTSSAASPRKTIRIHFQPNGAYTDVLASIVPTDASTK